LSFPEERKFQIKKLTKKLYPQRIDKLSNVAGYKSTIGKKRRNPPSRELLV
jgi:hypothetical protein